VFPSAKRTLPPWLRSCTRPASRTGDALLVALDAEQALVALSIADREAILRVLDDPPTGLAELRGVLVADHEGPVRDGLV
jgi:hypothetical protein